MLNGRRSAVGRCYVFILSISTCLCCSLPNYIIELFSTPPTTGYGPRYVRIGSETVCEKVNVEVICASKRVVKKLVSTCLTPVISKCKLKSSKVLKIGLNGNGSF